MTPVPLASLLLCLFIGLALHPAWGDVETSRLTAGEAEFLKAAAASAALETRLAGLAVRHGGSVALKAYAGMLMQDHRRFSLDLKAFAATEFMPVKQVIRAEDAALLHRVEVCEPVEFDAIMVDVLLRSHATALAAFEAQALDATSQRLKPFVTAAIPLLRAHRDMAAGLSAK